ncbi:MAG: hypothetical protein IJA41_09060 [Clostridia bacterium]|nr:hypothetical protein [Clostridia bacterium]
MLRLIGVILLCCVVLCIGYFNVNKYVRRRNYLSELCDFSAVCADIMRCENKSVYDVFKAFCAKEILFLKQLDRKLLADETAVYALLREHKISETDIRVIIPFITKLGCGDIAQQTAHCRYYSTRFGELLKSAETELNTKGKMQRSLFIFGSIALFIILV